MAQFRYYVISVVADQISSRNYPTACPISLLTRGVFSAGEFACLPVISPASAPVTAEEGRNLSLTCRVTADPTAEIYWSLNHRRLDPGNASNYGGRLGFR